MAEELVVVQIQLLDRLEVSLVLMVLHLVVVVVVDLLKQVTALFPMFPVELENGEKLE